MPVGQQSGREKEREGVKGGDHRKKSKMRQHLNIAQDCPLPPQTLPSLVIRIRADSDPGIF